MLLMLWFWTGCLDNCSAKALYVATIFFHFLMGLKYSGYIYNASTFDMDLFACFVLRFLFRLLTALQISFMKVAYNGTFSCHLLTPLKYEWFHIYQFCLHCQSKFNMLVWWCLLLWTIAGKVHRAPHWICGGLSPNGFCMLPTSASY